MLFCFVSLYNIKTKFLPQNYCLIADLYLGRIASLLKKTHSRVFCFLFVSVTMDTGRAIPFMSLFPPGVGFDVWKWEANNPGGITNSVEGAGRTLSAS